MGAGSEGRQPIAMSSALICAGSGRAWSRARS